MISNFELEELASRRGIDLIGVYSKDDLPHKKKVGSYIINMQNEHDGNGTHWVSFIIFENRKCCYFDSFGVYMPDDLLNWLSIFQPVAINKRQIQDIKSEMCGYFCIAFIEFFKNFDLKQYDVFEKYDDYINCFSNNLKMNDKIVVQLLDKMARR